MPTEKTLDLRGDVCPGPLIQVQEAVSQAERGDSFLVLVDYPLAAESIARWAEGEGYAVSIGQRRGEWEIRFRLP
ncbi:MAG: sulfurtransferase TusA family protein [Candidatus Tectomicrobia bacterium]|uniref:Sulfurtransferase TusA family protein n=1 Tax=Tectimicrobiota bacterium TaxID=2528274 RepID=A0A932HXL2_UNCTE|nr:sulfurtransferase TusA family protein [Candidatus Tectomicrobia bacterium]